MDHEVKNVYNLSDYLLVPSNSTSQIHTDIAAKHLSDLQISMEIKDILRKIKPYVAPDLTGYRSYRQKGDNLPEERNDKADLFLENKVYDKYLKAMMREFLIISIAFLRRMYAMHHAHILCGNIDPQGFIYDRTAHKIFRHDLDIAFSDKGTVHAEKHETSEFIYVKTSIRALHNNQYLAPELYESLVVYGMKHRLHDLMIEANHRDLIIEHRADIERYLRDFRQAYVKYSNKAEIYSMGYVLNELLSHLIIKLVEVNMTIYEFPDPDDVAPHIAVIAEQLLPDQFANPGDLRLLKLLNETVAAIYALMEPQSEKRDEIKKSLEKFISILRRLDEEPLTAVNDTSESGLDRIRAKRRKK